MGVVVSFCCITNYQTRGLKGEGNGNPLQYFCLENPRDRGAWWAAVYGVAQSRTQLKRLSSSSSKVNIPWYLLGCLTVYVKERHIPKGTGCEKALRQETDYVPSETLKDTWSEPVSKKEANGRWCWRGRRSETCRDLEQWEIRKQFQAGSNTIHVSLCLCFNVLAMPWGS